MSRPAEPEITWTLPMAQANVVLAVLSEQPFKNVADLIMEMRNQAQAQIQLFQQQLQQSMETEQRGVARAQP